MATATDNEAVFTEVLELRLDRDQFKQGLDAVKNEYLAFLEEIKAAGGSATQAESIGGLGALTGQISALATELKTFTQSTTETFGAMTNTVITQIETLDAKVEGAVKNLVQATGNAGIALVEQSEVRVQRIFDSMMKGTVDQANFSQAVENERFMLYSKIQDEIAAKGMSTLEKLTTANFNAYQKIGQELNSHKTDYEKYAAELTAIDERQFFERRAIQEKRDVEAFKLRTKETNDAEKQAADLIAIEEKLAADLIAIDQRRDTERAVVRGKQIALEQNREVEQAAIRGKQIATEKSINEQREANEYQTSVKGAERQNTIQQQRTKSEYDADVASLASKAKLQLAVDKLYVDANGAFKSAQAARVVSEQDTSAKLKQIADRTYQAFLAVENSILAKAKAVADGRVGIEIYMADKLIAENQRVAVESQRAMTIASKFKGVAPPSTPIEGSVTELEAHAKAVAEHFGNIKNAAADTGGFLSKMAGGLKSFSEEMGTTLVTALKWQLAYAVTGAAIAAAVAPAVAIGIAFKDGWQYLTLMEEKASQLQGVIASSVTLAGAEKDQFKLAGEAGEAAAERLQQIAIKTGIPVDRLTQAFKVLLSSGIGNFVKNLDEATVITQQLAVALQASGRGAESNRILLTEIPKLLNGTIDPSSQLLKMLKLSTEEWAAMLAHAKDHKDLLAQLAPYVVNYQQQVDEAAKKQGTLTDSIMLSLKQVEALVAKPMWDEWTRILVVVSGWFSTHESQIRAIAALIGETIVTLAKYVIQVVEIIAVVTQLGLAFKGIGLALVGLLATFNVIEEALVTILSVTKMLLTTLANPANWLDMRKHIGDVMDYAEQRFKAFGSTAKEQWNLVEDVATGSKKAGVNQPNSSLLNPITGSVDVPEGKAQKPPSQLFREELDKQLDARKLYQQQLKTLVAEGTVTTQQAAAQEIAVTKTVKENLDTLLLAHQMDIRETKGATTKQKDSALESARIVVENMQRDLDKQNEASRTEIAKANAKDAAAYEAKWLATNLAEYKEFLKSKVEERQKSEKELATLVAQGKISVQDAAKQEIANNNLAAIAIRAKTAEYEKSVAALKSRPNRENPLNGMDREERAALDALEQDSIAAATRTAAEERKIQQQGFQWKLQMAKQESDEAIRIAKASGARQTDIVKLVNSAEETAHNGRLQAINEEIHSTAAGSSQQIEAYRKLFAEQNSWQNQLQLQRETGAAATIADLKKEAAEQEKVRQAAIRSAEAQLALVGVNDQPGRPRSDRSVLERQILELKKQDIALTIQALQLQLNADGATVVQKATITAELEKQLAIQRQIGAAQLPGKDAGGVGFLFGDNRTAKEKTGTDGQPGKSALDTSFDTFEHSVRSLNHGFTVFSNAGNAIIQGFKQGGALGAAGAGASAVGGILSMFKSTGLAGEIVSAVGGVVTMISGFFTAHAQRVADDIKKTFDDTLKHLQNGDSTLAQTLAEIQAQRANAIASLSGVKGGQDQLNKLLPQFDDEIASLNKQIAQIKTTFEGNLTLLQLHNDAMSSFVKSWSDVNKQVKEYLDAGGDVAKAQQFLSESLKQQLKTATDGFNNGYATAIQDAKSINDLIQQRIDLIKQEKQTEFGLLSGDAIERKQSNAITVGQQLNTARTAFQKQLADLNSQIDLTTQKVKLESQIYDINKSVADLNAASNALQIAALNEQIKQAQAFKDIMSGISVDAAGNASLRGTFGTTIGAININVAGGVNPAATGQAVVDSIQNEFVVASRNGTSGYTQAQFTSQ